MKMIPTTLPDVVVLEPRVFGDDRGWFFESFNEQAFFGQVDATVRFVQDNHSRSTQHVLRGLHYQITQPQGKLVRVAVGEILDVAVDIRKSSPRFGQWVSVRLSAANRQQIWVPPGFAHGFSVLSDYAEVLYKTTDYYAPAGERTILWNDPDLAIDWQISADPILSVKDQAGKPFGMAEVFA
jgi:dTDP-4-dehydrorhamnose 3,5-epimerase